MYKLLLVCFGFSFFINIIKKNGDIVPFFKNLSKIDIFMRLSFIICASLIFFLSSQAKLPSPIKPFFGLDKVFHTIAFGAFAFTLTFWFKTEKWINNAKKYVLLVICITVLYGLSDEIHQYFVPNRSSSVYDLLADTLGAFLAVGLRLLLIKKFYLMRKNV